MRKLFRLFLATLSFLLLKPLFPVVLGAADRDIILATTTSTRDSGLLDVLIPLFEKKTGARVKTIAVGTGKALAMAKRGDADVLMTHAPEAEKALVDEGWLIHQVQFMHNDFILVGPAPDPAKVQGMKKAAEAIEKIARTESIFISRGDNSGTHQKEIALWKETGLTPAGNWYVQTGQGMAATLRIASEKRAYTLSDRATYLYLRRTLASKTLFEGDPVLVNQYSVALVNPASHPRINAEGAKRFHEWLLSAEARAVIRDYGKERFGQPLFFLDSFK